MQVIKYLGYVALNDMQHVANIYWLLVSSHVVLTHDRQT